MGIKHLCLIVAVTPTICSRVVKNMLWVFVKKLKNCFLATVRFPDVEKIEYVAQLIQARAPAIDDIIGFLDGLFLMPEWTSELIEQNVFYNGYLGDSMIKNIFE
jgi:hypothetical protein